MHFSSETARTRQLTAMDLACGYYSGRLNGFTDAVFNSADKSTVFAVTGLSHRMPAAIRMLNNRVLYPLLGGKHNTLLSVSGKYHLYVDNKEVSLDGNARIAITNIIDSVEGASGKLNESGDLIIDLKTPLIGTHYTVNLLLGNREGYSDPLQTTPKSVLDHFGRGSFRASQEKQVLATRYELNPDINGETANRQFYITENGRQIFYSLDVNTNVSKAYCIHHNNYTEIFYTTLCGLEIKRTIFILPQQDNLPTAVEAQRIEIHNTTDKMRELRVVVTGMFGITDPGTLTSDIIYANVVVESETFNLNGKPVAIAAHHKPKQCNGEKRFAMLLADGSTMDEYTSDVNGFINGGSYDRPNGLLRLSNAYSRRAASFFAMAKTVCADPGSTVTVDEFVGMSEDKEDVRKDFDIQLFNLYDRYRNKNSLEQTLEKVKKDISEYSSYISVNTDDSDLNAYLSHNLPFQVLYQTYISRSFAWTQKSYRETGFREIQDIYASMYYLHACGKDALIKKLLGSWISNVFEFGYAYHNFTTRGKEPGMCSDDQLWLVQAICRYIRLTGDSDFLKEEFSVAGSDKRRRLIDTLKAILIYSGKISVGKHHLPLLDRADWNDTLRLDKTVYEGPEKEQLYYKQLKEKKQEFGVPFESEQSESVMNAFLLVIAADDTAYLADLIGEKEISLLAHEIKTETTENIRKHAWKKDYYARCLINDNRPYKYLGSTGDNLSLDSNIDGSYYLNSFSWALLSDVADEKEIESMLNVIDRCLKVNAGLKLCTPVNYDLLDVITGTSFYFPGDRENGGVFKHAAMMATVASLKKAKAIKNPLLAERLKNLAYFMIDRTLPYKTLDDPFVLQGNPRFCTQYNNSETGENIGPILSGTASWLTLALYEAAGLSIEKDTITINPVLNRSHFHYTINIQGTVVDIDIDASQNWRQNDNSVIMIDQEPSSFPVSLLNDGKTHMIKIVL